MGVTKLAEPADSLAGKRLHEANDEQLMERYLQGDEQAFTKLLRRYEQELYSYLRRLTADAVLAEDVFQNTFLAVHVKRSLYERGRPFRPWLYTIATHQAIDALRRTQRHQRLGQLEKGGIAGELSPWDQVAGKSGDPMEQAERKEKQELVRQAVDELAEHLRTVIVLGYYQGMKYKEIADVLAIPVGTVKSRLHAAVKRLTQRWRQWGLVQNENP